MVNLIKEEETKPNRIKIHWKTIAKTCKTIAKFWVLLQLDFQIVPKKERRTIAKPLSFTIELNSMKLE